MLKTANTGFSFIEVWLTFQRNKPYEIENNVKITLIIGTGWYKWDIQLSQEKKYVEGYAFLSFAAKFRVKYGEKLMDTATKTGTDTGKTAS